MHPRERVRGLLPVVECASSSPCRRVGEPRAGTGRHVHLGVRVLYRESHLEVPEAKTRSACALRERCLRHGRLGGGGPAGRARAAGPPAQPRRPCARRTPPSAPRREPPSPRRRRHVGTTRRARARSRRSSATTDASAPPSVPATRSVAAAAGPRSSGRRPRTPPRRPCLRGRRPRGRGFVRLRAVEPTRGVRRRGDGARIPARVPRRRSPGTCPWTRGGPARTW